MLHLAMFLLFAGAGAVALAMISAMLIGDGRTIVRALRMQPLHGHMPTAPTPPRIRAPLERPAIQHQPWRAAA